MNALRSLVHGLWMGGTLAVWASLVILASVFQRGVPLYWLAVWWLRGCVSSARWILGVQVRVTGMDNLPPADGTPAVLLVKHQSTFEAFLMPTLMPQPLAYVFKRELLQVPFFGWAMRRLDMIHIDRSLRAQAFNKVVEQGQQLLGRGIWVIMFPEGTRIPRGEQGQYKSGGTRLAIATGAVVIPIAVTSAKCWPRKALIKRPGVVDVSIGRPIPSQGRSADELMREVRDWIEAEMQRLDPQAYPAPPGPQDASHTT